MEIDRVESEKDFQEWMESIIWVDQDGKIVPPVLVEDTSPDPEGDRG